MTNLTPQEITQVRGLLADKEYALDALQVIEECEGNLEYAFEVLMLESGNTEGTREFGTSLQKLANNCRNVICQEEFQAEIIDGFSRDFLNAIVPIITAQLAVMGNLPAAIAIPVVMYVIKIGIRRFCTSGESQS